MDTNLKSNQNIFLPTSKMHFYFNMYANAKLNLGLETFKLMPFTELKETHQCAYIYKQKI